MRKHVLVSAFVVLSLGALAIPSTADARGVHARKVRLQDRCDPASFNAAFGTPENPVICVPHAGELVTVTEFLAKLNPVDFGHEDWNIHPDELDLKSGDSIKVVVRGGEFHTFTEVDHFGAGCFLPINDALGLTNPPSPTQCAQFFKDTGVAANGASTLTVSGLSDGTHLFMCEIHPWMQTTVNVGDDDDD